MQIRFSIFIFWVFEFIYSNCFAQIVSPDSSFSPPIDSTRTSFPEIKAFGTRRDTTGIQPVKSGVDSSVTYSARTVEMDQVTRRTYLLGSAMVKYKNITIKAGKITILWNENTLIAEQMPDSSNGQSANSADSLAKNLTGRPEFSDGREKMVGDRMEYNFKTERGRIIRGRTEIMEGYYTGETLKRIAPKEFNVRNGCYSTCENEQPHFHFKGDKMKVIMGDKVVAKPVTFFIGKIPLAILPFAMFSTKEDGRQSGIIIPQFGTSPQEGRYLQNLGYYWATNDYLDGRVTLDFYERTGVLVRTHWNYALLYHFTGSIGGSFTRKNFDGSQQRRWNLDVRHNQKFNDYTTLNINGSFVNNKDFFRDLSNNRNERLSRQLISNATFSTRLGEGNSLSLNLSQTKDLETGRELVTLPRMQFTRNQSAFFPFKKDERRPSRSEPRWYNLIRYSYNNLLVNSVSKDSTNDKDAAVQRRFEQALTMSFTNPQKIFGWLTLSQNISYNEDWFDRTRTFSLVDSTNTVTARDKKAFATRRLFQYSASASTKLYGTFNTRIGALRGVRHVLTPSVSFSYQPDFSTRFWGYFESLEDTLGREIKRDRFEGSGARATPSGEINSLNFSLSNLFQMKLGEGEKEKKVDLFNLDINGGYNFAADSLNWSNLSTSLRANPKKELALSMNLSHSFYGFNRATGRIINELIFPRLLQVGFDARWNLKGKAAQQKLNQSASLGGPLTTAGQQLSEPGGLPTTDPYQDRLLPESAFSALDVPWSASISFSYRINKFNPLLTTRSAYLDLSNVEVQLTKNWRIGYRLRYDIERREVADQRISLYRDLHCWEAQFNWNPSGIGEGFYFRIGIKAPRLRDIKIEQRGGTTTVFRPF
jgi:hypothetical protein